MAREVDVEVVRSALLSPAGRKATEDRNFGQVIRIVRKALSWSQSEVGRRASHSQATISRLENSTTRVSHDSDAVSDVGTALKIPLEVLGITTERQDLDGDVRRRDFLAGAASVSAMVLLPRSIVEMGSVDHLDIDEGWRSLRRLNELDDTVGGSECYPVAADMSRRLQAALNLARLSPQVEKSLQHLTAAVMELTGWTAYDSGRNEDARRWWLESSYLAGLADADDVRVTALACMSLQACRERSKARETLSLISAARAYQDRFGPVLRSLLSAREAVAHSQLNNHYAAHESISNANELLRTGRDGSEPATFDFWGPADLAFHEMRIAAYERDARGAEAACRAALACVDPVAFPRNHMLYSVRLGRILAHTRQLDESIAITSDVVQKFDAVRGSHRIRRDLMSTLDTLGSRNHRPAQEFSTAARKVLGNGRR